MIKTREALPESLEHALIANRLLMTLVNKNLPDAREEALDQGIDLLNQMLEGKRLTDLKSISENSYNAALAYGEGVRAINVNAPVAGESPSTYLQDLVNIATKIRKGEEQDLQSVEKVKKFFLALRDLALAASEKRLERVSW